MKPSAFLLVLLLGCPLAPWAQDKAVDPALVPGKDKWPAKELPAVIPEYKGKVANYGNGGEKNWYMVYVVETDAQKVQAYVQLFKKAGWELSKEDGADKAAKDQYVVLVAFYPQSKLVGITVKTLSTDHKWPSKEFPALPAFGKCQSSSFTKNDYDWTIAVTKAKTEDMAAYKALLVQKGWEGDPEGEDFHWSKSKPPLNVQISDQGEGTWYFNVSEEQPD